MAYLLELIYSFIATSALGVGCWTSPSFDVLTKRGTMTTLQSHLIIYVDRCCGAQNVQTKKATHFWEALSFLDSFYTFVTLRRIIQYAWGVCQENNSPMILYHTFSTCLAIILRRLLILHPQIPDPCRVELVFV